VRCGEVALKGMNKPYFEKTLAERIRRNLKDYDGVEVKRHEGLIFVRSPKELNSEEIIRQVSRVFGVSSISPAVEAPSDLDAIGETAVEFMKQQIRERGIRTFKVEAKRADKTFPVKSPEIARIIGASVLIGCKVLKVDVHEPDCKLFVDLRRDRTYLYDEKIQGFGGLPLGTNGKGLVLLSGGIDSPVAAWMMAKRGMVIEALHFHSYPYTSPRAQQKVEELAGIVASYCGRMKIHVINLLPIQEQIVQNCPEEETTILVRRFMMRIGERIARRSGCMMLITGENLGQVASQTAEALVVTDACVQMPVMRPLIAMDKVDIMDKAMEIGTYEKSIEPYEDCCTVFLPKHPSTKPRLAQIEASEALLDVEGLVDAAVKSEEIVRIDAG
ncbi:tRNA uracil 4-sulfurtransferase ThiI, partial [Hornefia butyriciproducens]|uniref:tRNA uracil 4-sulfurtransferase ThiI n=1 Tax=Hornefia butyriciproducens TaxID=2652293 RepID=UPI0023F4DA28